jgi:lactate permease
MDSTLWHGLLALVPVLTLLSLTMARKASAATSALIVAVLAALIGVTAFQAGGQTLLVALGKGLWLAAWILAVVWPATLLYRIAEAGGFNRIGTAVTTLFPNRRENLLVVAWILPSFVQGVAGFGAPIAIAAPLLLACGWSRVRAVAYPLIGYHWSVTFGSNTADQRAALVGSVETRAGQTSRTSSGPHQAPHVWEEQALPSR